MESSALRPQIRYPFSHGTDPEVKGNQSHQAGGGCQPGTLGKVSIVLRSDVLDKGTGGAPPVNISASARYGALILR
jgi:hypothetical protein